MPSAQQGQVTLRGKKYTVRYRDASGRRRRKTFGPGREGRPRRWRWLSAKLEEVEALRDPTLGAIRHARREATLSELVRPLPRPAPGGSGDARSPPLHAREGRGRVRGRPLRPAPRRSRRVAGGSPRATATTRTRRSDRSSTRRSAGSSSTRTRRRSFRTRYRSEPRGPSFRVVGRGRGDRGGARPSRGGRLLRGRDGASAGRVARARMATSTATAASSTCGGRSPAGSCANSGRPTARDGASVA